MIGKSGYRFFGKDHAQNKNWSGMTIRRAVIPLQRHPVCTVVRGVRAAAMLIMRKANTATSGIRNSA